MDYEPLFNATDGGLDQLGLVSMHAEEGLSVPYSITAIVRTLDPADAAGIDAGAWLRKKVSVGVARSADPAWFHGIVTAVEHFGDDDKHYQLYRLELSPSFALLRHSRHTRVFKDLKPFDVVKSILSEHQVAVEFKATGAGGMMRHITQFEESDFAFVSRLLEQEGACYWFTHTKTEHKMVIGDAANHHPGSGAAIHATYITSTSALHGIGSEGVVNTLARRFEVVSKEAIVRDYSEQRPKLAAQGQKGVVADKTPGAGGKHNEADYHVTQSDADATAYATRLAESMTSRSCKVVGTSNVVAFRGGARIAVHGKDGYDEHVVLSRVVHDLGNGQYTNSFEGVPVGRLPWRPLRSTPLPRIDGVIPAIVTSAAGGQGAGEDGAYKVKILSADGDQDRIVRMAQPYAGTGRGMHFPLPINTEVVLTHEYGHPDRPVIAGAMHNTEDVSPVAEANKSQCVVRSACGAVLIFEDKQDEEKITLQSKTEHKMEFDDKEKKITLQSKDTNKLELDDQNEKVTLQSKAANKVVFDDKNEKMTIHAVKNHEVKVDGKSETKVTGKKTIDCDDEIEISAKTKITLKVDGHKIVISSSGIEITTTADIKLDAKGKVDIAAVSGVAIAAKGGDASLEGLNAKVSGQIGATVKGNATAELSASGQTTVKGAIVMIN
jgi:type VI secretion system secreted protein VgrG